MSLRVIVNLAEFQSYIPDYRKLLDSETGAILRLRALCGWGRGFPLAKVFLMPSSNSATLGHTPRTIRVSSSLAQASKGGMADKAQSHASE